MQDLYWSISTLLYWYLYWSKGSDWFSHHWLSVTLGFMCCSAMRLDDRVWSSWLCRRKCWHQVTKYETCIYRTFLYSSASADMLNSPLMFFFLLSLHCAKFYLSSLWYTSFGLIFNHYSVVFELLVLLRCMCNLIITIRRIILISCCTWRVCVCVQNLAEPSPVLHVEN